MASETVIRNPYFYKYKTMESEYERLKHARELAGVTLAELARLTGYALTTLSSVENGHDKPSQRLLEKWTSALGISATWLKTGKGEPFARAAETHGAKTALELDAALRIRLSKARKHAVALVEELDAIERESRKPPKQGKKPL